MAAPDDSAEGRRTRKFVEGLDIVRAFVRWTHAIGAVAWVGGSLFYLFALRPALMEHPQTDRAVETSVNKHFRDVVDLSILSLIVTGVVLTIDRLSEAPVSNLYFAVLALKLAAVLGMVAMARDLGTRIGRMIRGGRRPAVRADEPSLKEPARHASGWRRWLSPSRMVLALGLVAFFLSMVLVLVFENDVSGV